MYTHTVIDYFMGSYTLTTMGMQLIESEFKPRPIELYVKDNVTKTESVLIQVWANQFRSDDRMPIRLEKFKAV